MKKADIITYITTKWGDITSPKRLPTLDRDVANTLLNELYPTPVDDDSTTETYTTQNTAVISYNVKITKQGRSVRMNGSYTNNGTVALPIGTEVFAIKPNEYQGTTSEFLGDGVIYTPYKLSTRVVIAPSQNIRFAIIFNADF